MMTRNNSTERYQLDIIAIDQLVPEDHLVRKIELAIDFSFINPLVTVSLVNICLFAFVFKCVESEIKTLPLPCYVS